MIQKLVSIITVCYNSESTLKDTIESVLNQSYQNLEYIIIDGGSMDKTINVIKSFELKFKKKNITYSWISEPDKGIYDAMNKGLNLVQGDYIGILNSDDWYANDTVSKIIAMGYNKEYCIISGWKTKVNGAKIEQKTFRNKKDIKRYIHRLMPINHPATFVHKDVYKKIGGFNINYQLSADYDLIYRSFNSNVKFLFIDDVLVYMRNTGATHQAKNLFITAKEDYIIRKNNKVKLASVFYIKRLIFNYLIIFRNNLRIFLNMS